MSDENRVMTEVEMGIHKAIEECQNNPKHGIACVVFIEYPQKVVDNLHEEIEEVLSYHFDCEVRVDV